MIYTRYNCKYCNKEVDINKSNIGISQNNGCWHDECKNNKYKIALSVFNEFIHYIHQPESKYRYEEYFNDWLQDKLNNN